MVLLRSIFCHVPISVQWDTFEKIINFHDIYYLVPAFVPCRNICPSENFLVSLLTLGEGWHNFHHVFPWDYKTSEIGNNRVNPTTHFIDFCARIGWAYDLKTVPTSIVKKRVQRTGDGTHELWGWGDKDMSPEEKHLVVVINKKVM